MANQNKRFVIPIYILGAIALITLIFLNKPPVEPEEKPINVRTASVSLEPPVRQVQISGTTQSADTAVLRFQVNGRVSEKLVRLGDQLKKGAPIAKVYNPELGPIKEAAKNNFARLSAETEQAQRDFERVDSLFKEQAVTRQEWENAKTRLTSNEKAKAAAQADLARATQVSSETILTAPFSGSVTEVLIDVGEVIQAGAPAVRVSNPEAVELKLAVSDSILRQVVVGQEVNVSKALDPLAEPIIGRISEISPYRERGALPEIIVNLDALSIGPGVAVNASLDIQAKHGIGIPVRSVLMTGDNTVAVYKVVNGRAKLVPIRPLSLSSDQVVIEQSLDGGDKIVVEGLAQLYDGAKVTEVETSIDAEAEE